MTKDELARWWRSFAENECHGYSPLYEQICNSVAASEDLLDRLLSLSSHAYQPNMLLAGVHDVVLRGGAPALAEIYAGGSSDDVGRLFVAAALEAWADLAPILETRRTQTNEIGRIALLAPAMASAAPASPCTVVDVGTSAGLTLMLDSCLIDYGPRGQIGRADSPVRVSCDVLHGDPPIRSTPVARRIGLDRRPLDLTDADDARWLIACTWPDTGRLDQTRAAVALAAADPPEIRTGDAVDDLPALLDELEGAAIVTTTWALAYLSPDRRTAFSDVLAAASKHRGVVWISAEGPGVVEPLPMVEAPDVEGSSASVLGAVSYDEGDLIDARVLAHCHPHGQWLWWHSG